MPLASVRLHALTNAFLADFCDVARLYFLLEVDPGELWGGKGTASFVVVITSAVAAASVLGVAVAYASDAMRHPERLARLGALISACTWTALAASRSLRAEAAAALVVAEFGIVVWSCAMDASRVRGDPAIAEKAQIVQISGFWLGTALALALGGGAAEIAHGPFYVFGAAAAFAWAATFALPALPETLVDEHCYATPPHKVAWEIATKLKPWILLNTAVLVVPSVSDAVVFFLAKARGASAFRIGMLGAFACALSGASAMLMDRILNGSDREVAFAVLCWGLFSSCGAIGLTTLGSTSEVAEEIPAIVRASFACVLAAGQAAMCVPFYSRLSRELHTRNERRASVNALVQTMAAAGKFVGSVATVMMCRDFGISGDSLRGVYPLLHVAATLQPLPMVAVPFH